MEVDIEAFRQLAAALSTLQPQGEIEYIEDHPFDTRNLHSGFSKRVRKLFDNGHYTEAIATTFKIVESNVKRISELNSSGKTLMMDAFNVDRPAIALNSLITDTDRNIQEGFKFLFAGSTLAIRNPSSHEVEFGDDPDKCLTYLSLATLLLRTLEEAGFQVNI